jgi:hypothetical protein
MMATIRFVSNCPHFSLKGTHTTIDGEFLRFSIIARSSDSKCDLASCESFQPLGMSCHIGSPSLSA